jgi:hypothetical protein
MSLEIPPPPRPGIAVVARYQEDFDWTASPWPVCIVQKDRDLPNAGREASSYAWFCANHQVEADQTYAFLQGNPMPHAFGWAQLRQVDRFAPLGAYHLRELPDGSPNHPGLDLAQAFAVLGCPGAQPSEFEFTAGAQFLVSGRVLLRRDRAWWAWLQQVASGGIPELAWLNPWVMERLWPYLLAG